MSGAERAASMSPEELIAVIERGLDTDEQKALAALRPDVCCWEFERLGHHDRLIEMYTYEDGTEDSDPIAFFGGPGFVEHTARHDPSRVLADVAAKREILAWHRAERDARTPRGKPVQICRCGYDLPCATLRALARPYLGQETP